MSEAVHDKGWQPRDDTGGCLFHLFDWFTMLPRTEASALREEIFGTIMLRPAALVLSSIGILFMSGTAMIISGARWAAAWFALDILFLIMRSVVSIREKRSGRCMSASTARIILLIALPVLLLFGAGCTASVCVGGRS